MPAIVFLLALLAAANAHADIYLFTDAAGITHFSNVPNDARYERIDELSASAASAPMPERAVAPTPSKDWAARAARYDKVIDRAARAAAIHPSLVRALILVESGFYPNAVSKRGAVGLMQLRPATAKHYGAVNLFDPEQNISAGTRYLRDLIMRFKKLELALAAYNAGEAAVEHYGGRVPPFDETVHYVPNVLKTYALLRSQPSRN